MSELLGGKEQSGTPLETRGGTRDLAGFFQSLLKGTGGQQFKNMTAPGLNLPMDALMAMFGDIGAPGVARDLLADPRDRTRGLFASLEPFENQQTERAVAGTRGMFGTMGGRFGRNVADAEGKVRGELSNQFMRSREEALLSANDQRANILFSLLNAGQQAANTSMIPMQMMSQFFQGGQPTRSEGILPGLLSAGLNFYGIQKLMGNKTTPTSGAPGYIPQRAPGISIPQGRGYFG